MSTSPITALPFPQEAAPPPPRGRPLLAWLVIAGVVGFLIWRQATRPTGEDSTWRVVLQMQGRYLVGVNSLRLPGGSGQALYAQARSMLDSKGFSQRLRLAVLAGELVGPEEAGAVLSELERQRRKGELEPSERALQAWALLRKLYTGYEKDPSTPSIPANDQADLRRWLGWFGDLALAPEGGDPAARARALAPARRTVVGYIVLGLCALFALVAGSILFVVLVCLACVGRLRLRLAPPRGHGGVYAETFAVYMLVYLGLAYLARFLPEGWMALWVQGLAMLVSLVALAWPRLRGLPWRQVRQDLGLGAGEGPLTEAACGVGTYVAAVPALFVGILVMLGLMFVQRRLGLGDALERGGPSHPIIGVALTADWWVWLQVFLVACVVAPLVEEIMFRGALYAHLRQATGRAGRVLSVLLAALASGFVFAVIHPQGWLGVPPLLALAFVFALAREWRGSLLPPMVAHGVNNGVSTLMLLLLAA